MSRPWPVCERRSRATLALAFECAAGTSRRSAVAAQTGGDLFVYVDQRCEILGQGIRHQGKRFGHDEEPQICEVLPNLDRKRTVVLQNRVDEDRPKSTI